MQEQDKNRFAQTMLALAEAFNSEISDQGLHLRFEAMREHSIEAVEKACIAVMRTRKYTTSMPTVAEVLEHIQGGNVEHRAEVEAATVLQAISRHGGYASVVFDDPVTQAVIQMGYGGWAKLCAECMEHERKWTLRDIARMYRAYAAQGVHVQGHLAGQTEIDNSAKGYPELAPAPMLVGDRRRAQQVLEQGTTAAAIEHRERAALCSAGEALDAVFGRKEAACPR